MKTLSKSKKNNKAEENDIKKLFLRSYHPKRQNLKKRRVKKSTKGRRPIEK